MGPELEPQPLWRLHHYVRQVGHHGWKRHYIVDPRHQTVSSPNQNKDKNLEDSSLQPQLNIKSLCS